MHFLWLIVAVVMGAAYIYLEWVLTNKVAKVVMRRENDHLTGKRRKYAIATGVIAFTGTTALYFAGLSYIGGPFQPVCWLSTSIFVSAILSMGTYMRLRSARFQEEND